MGARTMMGEKVRNSDDVFLCLWITLAYLFRGLVVAVPFEGSVIVRGLLDEMHKLVSPLA